MRSVAAIIAGLIAGFIGLALVSVIGEAVFPTNIAVNLRDPAQIKASFAALPLALKIVTTLGWFATGLVGGLVAKRISGRIWPVWTVAGLFALYVVVNIAVLPMPAWMQAASLAAPLLGAAIAHHYGPGRSVRDDEDDDFEDPDDVD
jgi:purine-cytosine permease-like protein